MQISVNNLANGSIGSIKEKDTLVDESSLTNDEAVPFVESDLPLVGDYVGIGGPDAVPLETQGAFEKPEKVAGSVLDDLFMAPSETHLLSMRRTISNFEISQNKSRLKWNIFFHSLLSILMALKLLPEILDKLDIFILEIEELLIPKPQLWEWIWMSSILPTAVAWSACKKSKAFNMKFFQLLNVATGLLPVIIGMSYHFSDFYDVVSSSGDEMISKWMGVPTSVLWYIFLFIALQIQLTELYLANTLINAWKPKKTN